MAADEYKKITWTIALILCAIPAALWSQAVGSISGTVTDSTGAVVRNASVTALRVDTGVAQSVVTNTAGLFTFSNLVVGTYTVTVRAAGFAPQTVSDITLDVTQQRDLSIKLSVAGATQVAEVTAPAPLLPRNNSFLLTNGPQFLRPSGLLLLRP